MPGYFGHTILEPLSTLGRAMSWKSDGPNGHYLFKLLKDGEMKTSMTAKDVITNYPEFGKYNYELF